MLWLAPLIGAEQSMTGFVPSGETAASERERRGNGLHDTAA